ncbi:twin-arginine translocase TatA/TatE family subunit [Tessaracoccus sp. OS52]|uniref:twin-arginine translocase TatA/TatE family subunit n=1 Tax=Tessaracoccus sp. OS52 TaxID=2886691 RepID=UPI002102C61E|nr:twin-arginine translocase TatA/TatE family subunit [Tessaracoccus sp. OS52]
MPGGWEWLIILAIALLLFGGSRLAGLGKGVGRSIREFKEEVKPLGDGSDEDKPEVVDAEIVQRPEPRRDPAQIDRAADIEARERELAAREEELRRQREAETGS